MLKADILKEIFNTTAINNVKSWFINTYIPNMLKKSSLTSSKTLINISDVLKNSYCISIDKHKYLLFNTIFKKCGFKTIPKLMHGIINKDNTPAMNCKNSHLNVVKYAKKCNLPYVLIFEDDAYPCNNIIIEFQKYLNNIPNDTNLILFGWSSHSLNIKQYGK
jgi:hypothetical protein